MKKISILILLWLSGVFGINAQTPASQCACPEEEIFFGNADYFKSFYQKFQLSCLTGSFNIKNVDNTNLINAVKMVAQANGSAQQVLFQVQQSGKDLLKALKNPDATTTTVVENLTAKASREMKNTVKVKMWTAHLACQFTNIAHNHYFAHPEDAPSAHESFYKAKGNGATDNKIVNSSFNMEPLLLIILAAVLLLSILISVLISGAITAKRVAANKINPEELLQNPALEALIKAHTKSISTVLMSENKKLKEALQAQEEKIKNFSETSKKLDQVMKQSGAIDVNKLQTVLSDLSKKVKDLEESPVRRENLRVVLQPEDFLNFIQKNPDIKEAVKEGLDIVQVRDMLVKILPHPLNTKDLGELDKETIARYWRIYTNSPEYFPEWKKEILNELKKK